MDQMAIQHGPNSGPLLSISHSTHSHQADLHFTLNRKNFITSCKFRFLTEQRSPSCHSISQMQICNAHILYQTMQIDILHKTACIHLVIQLDFLHHHRKSFILPCKWLFNANQHASTTSYKLTFRTRQIVYHPMQIAFRATQDLEAFSTKSR